MTTLTLPSSPRSVREPWHAPRPVIPLFREEMLVEEERPDPVLWSSQQPVGDDGRVFNLALAPWIRLIWEWVLDPTVRVIYLIQGSQTSKTTAMMLVLLYFARYMPRPTYWIGAVEEEINAFVTQRLKPFLELADSKIRTGKKSDWRTRDLRLYGKMLVHFAYATSPKVLRSWPAFLLIGDECGIWPFALPGVGEPIEYMLKRMRTAPDGGKALLGTTPRTEDHPSWLGARDGDFYRWFVPCPLCGHRQFLDFRRVIFKHCKEDAGWNLSRVKADTYYECVKCKGRIDDPAKAAMIAAGAGVCVDIDTGLPKASRPGNEVRTLHIPSTYSLFTSFGKLGLMYLRAKRKGPEALRIFRTDEEGMPWKEDYFRPTPSVLAQCIDRDRPRGVCPEWAQVLTCGIDVMDDSLYYSIWAWGYGYRSALVYEAALPRGGRDEPLDVLDEILTSRYGSLPVRFSLIDAGDNTQHVYTYCRSRDNAGHYLAPSRGVPRAIPQWIKRQPVDRDGQGNELSGGLHYWEIDVGQIKVEFHGRMSVPQDAPRCLQLHKDVPRSYLDKLLSEAWVSETKNGKTTWSWKVLNPPNHHLDTAVYAFAAGIKVGVQLLKKPVPSTPAVLRPEEAAGFTTPDGRPYLVTERT